MNRRYFPTLKEAEDYTTKKNLKVNSFVSFTGGWCILLESGRFVGRRGAVA